MAKTERKIAKNAAETVETAKSASEQARNQMPTGTLKTDAAPTGNLVEIPPVALGSIVTYIPGGQDTNFTGAEYAAMVCGTNTDGTVNLQVFSNDHVSYGCIFASSVHPASSGNTRHYIINPKTV